MGEFANNEGIYVDMKEFKGAARTTLEIVGHLHVLHFKELVLRV
jgi:hypothetical protein